MKTRLYLIAALLLCIALNGCENPCMKELVEPLKFKYKIGDTGPGGGIIFYFNRAGFTMTDTGKKAHYLEAARSDIKNAAGDILIKWGEDTGVPGTSEALGSGRNNTRLMFDYQPSGATDTASQLCLALGNDWFIPSWEELVLLWNNIELSPSTSFYWSSTQEDNNYAVSLSTTTGKYSYQKSGAFSVRPIRAF